MSNEMSDTDGEDKMDWHFTEADALRGMLDIAIETGEELLEDPTPTSAGLLKKTADIITHEISKDVIESLGFNDRREWKILTAFAEGKATPVDKIIDACATLLDIFPPPTGSE